MQFNYQFFSQLFTIREIEVNYGLKEIGITFFELLIKQICLFQMNQMKIYQQILQKTLVFIIKNFNRTKNKRISRQTFDLKQIQRFYENLGCFFIDRDFKMIEKVKYQLDLIISSFFQCSLKQKTSQYIQSNSSLNITSLQDLTIMKIKYSQPQLKNSQINSRDSQSQAQKINSKLSALINQLKQLKIKQNDTIKLKVKQCSSELQLKVFVLREQKNKEVSHNVDDYLRRVHNYRNQLNYFCLMSKIPNAVFNTYKVDSYTHVSMTEIKFKCKYLANSMVNFKGQATDRYLKSAQNKAALMILRSIYKQIPQLWKQFLEMKQKKQIFT